MLGTHALVDKETETLNAVPNRPWNGKGATLALLAFAMLIVSLDQYIVVVALPEIGRDLGYSAQTLQSVISAYAVNVKRLSVARRSRR